MRILITLLMTLCAACGSDLTSATVGPVTLPALPHADVLPALCNDCPADYKSIPLDDVKPRGLDTVCIYGDHAVVMVCRARACDADVPPACDLVPDVRP